METAAELVRRKSTSVKQSRPSDDGTKQQRQKNRTSTDIVDTTTKTTVTRQEPTKSVDEDDIDDEIKRLEARLNSSNNKNLECESNNDDNDDDDDETNGSYNDNDNDDKNLVLRSSLLLDNEERIEGLTNDNLPKMKRRKLKGIDNDWKTADVREISLSKDIKANTNTAIKKLKSTSKNNKKNNDILKIDPIVRNDVLTILNLYDTGRSNSGKPYYCRLCNVQYNDETSFLQHRTESFHIAAVQIEKQQTYCTICKKQLTSIIQYKDHIQSRPHKEKVQQQSQQKQQQQRFNSGSNRGRQQYSNNNTTNDRPKELTTTSTSTTIIGNNKYSNYCCWCKKQYVNEEEFKRHKITSFHRNAEMNGRKNSFCTVCYKQLTSPDQLIQHQQSKAHQEQYAKYISIKNNI